MIEFEQVPVIGTYGMIAANKLWLNLEVQGWTLLPIDSRPFTFDQLWGRHCTRR